jgi:hypothetical protein
MLLRPTVGKPRPDSYKVMTEFSIFFYRMDDTARADVDNSDRPACQDGAVVRVIEAAAQGRRWSGRDDG